LAFQSAFERPLEDFFQNQGWVLQTGRNPLETRFYTSK